MSNKCCRLQTLDIQTLLMHARSPISYLCSFFHFADYILYISNNIIIEYLLCRSDTINNIIILICFYTTIFLLLSVSYLGHSNLMYYFTSTATQYFANLIYKCKFVDVV